MSVVTFSNPSAVHKPGRYSHAALVSGATRQLVISGQVGTAPDGTILEGGEAQIGQSLANLGAILAAHGRAVLDGISVDSTAYFRELDRAAAALEGNRGNRDGDQRNGHMPNGNGFNGAPPGRGDEGDRRGGSGVVNTGLGPVTVGRNSRGEITVNVPKHLLPDFEEGAKITGMKLGDYIYDHVKIAQERAAGGTGGLTMREGETYR